jgi:8-oxo-dGTP pyrophosphatase MutT (NUDIX family)
MDGEAKKGANGLSEGGAAGTGGGAATWKLRRALSRLPEPQSEPQSRGDYDLNPGMGRAGALIPAAVLVPVFDSGAAIDVLFTKRAIDLTDHAGEISFPGGRIEPTDDGAAAAALRETEEELGLPSHQIEIIGTLDLYETRTGFLVTPMVGLVAPPLILRPDPREVAEVIRVPLGHLLNRMNYRSEEREAGGKLRWFYSLPFGDYVIWGATAGMLVNLCERVARHGMDRQGMERHGMDRQGIDRP